MFVVIFYNYFIYLLCELALFIKLFCEPVKDPLKKLEKFSLCMLSGLSLG